MHVTAVANQKGGVGKTTTVLGLAVAFAERGEHVTVIDLDPQHSATQIMGIDPAEIPTLSDLLDQPGAGLSSAAVHTTWGVDLVPGDRALGSRERGAEVGAEFLLREAIAAGVEGDRLLIDCPPSLGLLTITGLVAADDIVMVTEATFPALQGSGAFADTVERVRARYQPALELAGVIVNRWRQTIEQQGYLAELDAQFPDGQVWRPLVPLSVAAEATAATGMPLRKLRRRGAAGLASIYDLHASQLASMHANIQTEEVS